MKKDSADKSSRLGLFIIIFIFAAVIVGGLLLQKLSSQTRYDSSGSVGNTAANLYNLGLFCEYDGRIYFSNNNDDGLLYSMDRELGDFALICDDNVRYINVDSNYIYYSRNNNLKEQSAQTIFIFYSNGIFRISHKGKDLKMLWNQPIGSMMLYDNRLFYQYYSDGSNLSIHCMGIDGEDDVLFIDDQNPAVCIYNNRLYYTGYNSDHYLHSASVLNASAQVEAETGMYCAVVENGALYYIDLDHGYRLCRAKTDGSEVEVICPDRCCTFNVSSGGRYVYYQTDGGTDNAMYLYDRISGTTELICRGDHKWINLAGDYCFFYKYDESAVYAYKDGKLSYFNPPVLSED